MVSTFKQITWHDSYRLCVNKKPAKYIYTFERLQKRYVAIDMQINHYNICVYFLNKKRQ